MSSKIEVQLTQYTPLLHFQGQESGACLRASEVKPALDHFITAWLKKINKTAPPQWIQSEVNGHTAYRYRMTFTANGEMQGGYLCNKGTYTTDNNGKPKVDAERENDQNRDSRIHKLFFAAMGLDGFDITPETRIREIVESRIKGVFYPEGMTMTILITGDHDNMLSALLKELIPPFFALHCFGNRSNKGFGSFGVTKMDGDNVPDMDLADLIQYTPIDALYFAKYGSGKISQNNPNANVKKYLDDVFMLSQVIKAGLNYTGGDRNDPRYFKGLIFKYFLGKSGGIHAEKRFIKNKILGLPGSPVNQYRFVRAVIGLPQTYEYKNINRTINIGYDENDTKKKITRYENPIHFKPFGNYLLMIPQRIPERMFDNNLFRLNDIPLSTPNSDSFQLTEFIDYCLEEYKNNYSNLMASFNPHHQYFNGNRIPKIPTNASKMIFESLNRITSIEKAEPKAGDEHNG